MNNYIEILEKLLLSTNQDWRIEEITCDDPNEEIHIRLSYFKPDVVVDGVHYPLYDHRPPRTWRHLDIWQYKTIITARIPRYVINGKVKSVTVPWASSDTRITYEMEKKMY